MDNPGTADRAAAEKELLTAYDDALKDAYVQMRRRWEPKYGEVHFRYFELFRVAARKLKDERLDPYEYVQYAFDTLTPHYGALHPNMVTSLTVIEKFRKDAPDQHNQRALLVQLQVKTLEREMDRGRPLVENLIDPQLEMSAVFRYAMAQTMGEPQLLERFHDAARKQVLFKPYYKELLKGKIPEEW